MSNKGIATKERVYAAADKLFAQGTIVTQEKVRKEIKGGSYATIGKYLKEWKEREDNDTPTKSYPMPDQIKKTYEEMNQAHWNTFCGKYELTTDNEKIAELEKENELLRERLEIAEQDSIRLEQLDKLYKEALEQQRKDAVEIQDLKNEIDHITS
jgi:hypothetical protein